VKLIQTVTVGSGGAASIEFTSIPQTYTDVVIVGSLRSTSTTSNTGEYDPLGYRFNNSTSGYTTRNLQGNGSATGSSTQSTMTASAGGTYGRISNSGINNSLSGSSIFTSLNLYIPNYAGNTNKSWSTEYSQEGNTTTRYSEIIAGLWSNTAAISSITLALLVANFAQYSSVSLYGITKGSGGATAS
jgi:hypothetical protein